MAASAGKLVKVYVDMASVGGASANWALIAQQDDFSIKYSTDKVDTRTKDDAGTPNDMITGHGWSGSFGGKLSATDTAYLFLKSEWAAETKVWLKFAWDAIGGTSQEGETVIELEEKAAGNGVVEYTCTFNGQGSLVTAVV